MMKSRGGRPTSALGRIAIVLTVSAAAALTRPSVGEAQQPTDRPLGLETLARSALDSNRDLHAARYGLETAREQVSEAWSNVYPSVNLNASFSRDISPNVQFLPAQIFDPTAGPDDYISVQFGADNNWRSTISFEQPIFRAGALVGVWVGVVAADDELFGIVICDHRKQVRHVHAVCLQEAAQLGVDARWIEPVTAGADVG